MTPCRCCGDDPVTPGKEVFRAFIPREAKSANEHRVNNAGGWKYRKDRDRWESDLRTLALVHKPPRPTGKRRVFLTRIYSGGQREFDGDNLPAGLKGPRDALVKAGYLIDDSPRWAIVHYHQRKDDHLRGVEVVIEEIE